MLGHVDSDKRVVFAVPLENAYAGGQQERYELRPEDLQGSQGSYQLRMEILRRVNLVIAPAKVNAVLIEEMLIN